MLKFMLMSGVFSVMLVSAVNAQNVTVSDDVFGKNDEIGTKSLQPSVDRVYKIDNAAKKKVELNQNDIKNSDTSSEQSEGLKKNSETSEEAITDTENKTSDFKPYIGGYKKRSLEEIQENLKLPPQELLEKVREERQKAKEEAAKQPLVSSEEYNKSVTDALKERREERRNMTKAERRAVKEELKILYKARRDERRNMTKAERRAIKEELKAKEKARREQQKEDRKNRRKMRQKD